MKYTSNYNLKKPEGSDTVNIDDLNDNFDVIDQALKNHEDDLASKETPAGAQAKAEAAAGVVRAELDAHKTENASTSQKGHVQLSTSTTSTSTSLAATASAVKTVNDALTSHKAAAAPHSGHETPAGAQAKAEAALNSAKQYTDQEVGEVAQELAAHKAENATLNQLGHVNHAVLTATLDTSWSGSSAPYTKTISVSGILSTDVPFIDIVMSGTYATDTARQEAWGYIYRAVTANGSITFYATDKPTVSLPLQIKVVR